MEDSRSDGSVMKDNRKQRKSSECARERRKTAVC